MNQAEKLNLALDGLHVDAQLPPEQKEQFDINLETWRKSWLDQLSMGIKAVRDDCDLEKAIGHLMLSERIFVTDRPLAFNEAQNAVISKNVVEFVDGSQSAIKAVVKTFLEKCVAQVEKT